MAPRKQRAHRPRTRLPQNLLPNPQKSGALNQKPKFGIVLVVVLVLGALGLRDRKETDVLQLICSVSLIAKRSGFSRTRTTTSTRTTPQIRNLGSSADRGLRLRRGPQLQSPDFRVNGTNRTGQSTRFRIAPGLFSTSNKF